MVYSSLIISMAILAAIGALCGRFFSVFILVPANLFLALSVIAASVGLSAGPGETLLWIVIGSFALQFGYLSALAMPQSRRRAYDVKGKFDNILRAEIPPSRSRAFSDGAARERALEPGRLDVGD